jgi:hypothetical protein
MSTTLKLTLALLVFSIAYTAFAIIAARQPLFQFIGIFSCGYWLAVLFSELGQDEDKDAKP